MAGLGVSRNDSPFVFCLVCKCASGRLCHLEKRAFWAIIEGPFVGYAFRSCQKSQDSQLTKEFEEEGVFGHGTLR